MSSKTKESTCTKFDKGRAVGERGQDIPVLGGPEPSSGVRPDTLAVTARGSYVPNARYTAKTYTEEFKPYNGNFKSFSLSKSRLLCDTRTILVLILRCPAVDVQTSRIFQRRRAHASPLQLGGRAVVFSIRCESYPMTAMRRIQ